MLCYLLKKDYISKVIDYQNRQSPHGSMSRDARNKSQKLRHLVYVIQRRRCEEDVLLV